MRQTGGKAGAQKGCNISNAAAARAADGLVCAACDGGVEGWGRVGFFVCCVLCVLCMCVLWGRTRAPKTGGGERKKGARGEHLEKNRAREGPERGEAVAS